MPWLLVVLAGVLEIAWAQSLRAAAGFTRLGSSALALVLTVAVWFTR